MQNAGIGVESRQDSRLGDAPGKSNARLQGYIEFLDFHLLRQYPIGEVREMEIRKLDSREYKGKEYHTTYLSRGYYEIEFMGDRFSFVYRPFRQPQQFELSDTICSDWLESPSLYGAFEGGELIGFAEGFLERWNNRYRISNLCVFDERNRHCGAGTLLMERMLQEAGESGARMAVLETQSRNERAIAFYRRNGFEVIGFDRYAYSNDDPEHREIRVEMGKKIR